MLSNLAVAGVVEVEIYGAKNMNDEIAIAVTNLSKCYHFYERPLERLKQALWGGARHKEFWALRDVSFSIKKGEAVGIIGRNGSGKSTLLQIIAGTLKPSAGDVTVNGRVAALLELGSGFNPEFTGRENVFLNGAVLGIPRSQIEAQYDEIAAFADIGDFIDQPVKEYSSGMVMRLAFAVQVVVEPDILIVDEALSVGDFFFQQKCLGRIRELQATGTTILFVSHDTGTVRDLCQRAIYLRKGHVQYDGHSSEAIRFYFSEQPSISNDAASNADGLGEAGSLHGNAKIAELYRCGLWNRQVDSPDQKGKLLAVGFYDSHGFPTTTVRMGEDVTIVVAYVPHPDVDCIITVGINNKYNQLVTATGSDQLGLNLPKTVGVGGAILFELSISLLLEAGNYSLTVTLGYPTGVNRGERLDQTPPIGPIQVMWDYERDLAPFVGPVGLPAQARCLL